MSHTPNVHTNLVFEDRRWRGGEFRLVVFIAPSTWHDQPDVPKIEVYEITAPGIGGEQHVGYLNRDTPEDFTIGAMAAIRTQIRSNPFSKASLDWLRALNYCGLLADYEGR